MRKFVFGGSYASAVPLLLDTYPATVAYSLRKLRTAYSGSAIRVRRSNDNAEQDIGFVGNDLDTASLSSFVGANSAYVVTWYDQSGNGLNVVQSTVANQPQLVSSGSVFTLNSKPAFKCDGSNDYLTRGTSLPQLHGNDWSYNLVANNEANNASGVVWSNRLPSGSNIGCLAMVDRRTNVTHTTIDTGAASTIYTYLATDNTNSQRLVGFYLDSTDNGEAFLNGVSQSTATLPTALTNGGNFDVGRQLLGVIYLNGYIQELIFFSVDESANRIAIETDINTYYGIY